MENNTQLNISDLTACLELGKSLTSELDHNRLYKAILDNLSARIPAHNWSLLLKNKNEDTLYFKICVGLDTEHVKGMTLKIDKCIAGRSVIDKKPVIIEDVNKCDFFNKELDKKSGFTTRSIICVPVIFADTVLGIIEAINPEDMDEKTIRLLSYYADYAAVAVENNNRYQRIQQQLIRDDLTGLYNTRFLHDNLEKLVVKCSSKNSCFSLIFIDLDNFKQIVDTHGHLNGSNAIREVGETLSEITIDPSFAVAYGGDEFIVVLPGQDKDAAVKTAKKIMQAMKKRDYLTNYGLNVNISASFGIASFPEHATDITQLLNLADKALFRIKDTGKDSIAVHE